MATMAKEVYFKTPTEAKIFTFEISQGAEGDITESETISTAVFTSLPSGVTWGTASISTPFVESKATGGSNGVDYTVYCDYTTSEGQTLQVRGILKVRA